MPLTQKHFLKALYDSFPEPVVIVDSARVIVSVNAAACEQFGYTDTELAGQPMRLLYASDEDYALCLSKPQSPPGRIGVVPDVYRHVRKDGSVFSAKLKATDVIGDEGETLGLIGIVHDISDFLEVEQQRHRLNEILNTALGAIPEAFAIFDRQEKLIIFNEAYRDICGPVGPLLHAGMTAEEIIRGAQAAGNYPLSPPGTPDSEVWIASRLKDFRDAHAKPAVFPYSDGRWLQAKSIRTEDGHIVVLRIDVTDLKEAELALDRQRLDFYSLVQNIPDFVTRLSREKTYTFVNDHYARFLNVPAEELVGRSVFDFVPPGDHQTLLDIWNALTPEAPVVKREQHRVLKDGSNVWIFWSNMGVFHNGELAEFITVGRDITELKQQQIKIAAQSAELQRKNDALNRFTGTVSHDLKAPLRHMAMFSDMISEDVAHGELGDLPVYTQHLRQSARRMDQLIDSLLEYAQIADQVGNWSSVRMAEVVGDSILNLDSFVQEAGASFDIGALPDVRGDSELLKRLFQNLIGNAIKYRKPNVSPHIRIFGEARGDTVRVCVEDNGIGIEPRFSEKIFDVFQRLHRDETQYKGTGIGLALAKRIAESHSGSIELDTSFGDGARFSVFLPAKPGPAHDLRKIWDKP